MLSAMARLGQTPVDLRPDVTGQHDPLPPLRLRRVNLSTVIAALGHRLGDHNVPGAMRGETSLVNLGRVCHHHHDFKTRRDLRRVGPLGHQRLVTTAEYARAGP